MHFHTLDLIKFLMSSSVLNMGTISGKIHIMTILSFWPGVAKHFIGDALCSSDASVTQLM
jgi:hypothetical protein